MRDREERDRESNSRVHSSREKEAVGVRETEGSNSSDFSEMAASEGAAAEGSVIAIHSLDEWSIQIDEANSTDPKKLVVIDFTATWCGPCHVMAPIFADLAKKFPNVVFLKVDVDEMKTIAEQFSVEAMPTFLFFKGGDVKDRVVGAVKEELVKKLELQMAQ